MKIGIVGAGSMGTTLARHFASLRHDPDATSLERALAQADRSRIAEYRANEEDRIRQALAPATA